MKERQFEATLVAGDRALGWTVAHVPFAPHAAWPAMLRQRVCGKMTGPSGSAAFRSSLFPVAGASGAFMVLVTRAMQAKTGTALGVTAHFCLQPDLQPRPAELPAELDMLLDEADGLRTWYESNTEYARREMGKWVSAPKGADARQRRAHQMAERMLITMEAETEVPPMLQHAFRKNPKAARGWKALSATHRRTHLFALFGYLSPEARQKRLDKLIAAAEEKGTTAQRESSSEAG